MCVCVCVCACGVVPKTDKDELSGLNIDGRMLTVEFADERAAAAGPDEKHHPDCADQPEGGMVRRLTLRI